MYFSRSIIATIAYCSLVWSTSSPSLMTELEYIHAGEAKTIHRLSWDISDQEALESLDGNHYRTNQYKKELITLMYKVNSNTTTNKVCMNVCIQFKIYKFKIKGQFNQKAIG